MVDPITLPEFVKENSKPREEKLCNFLYTQSAAGSLHSVRRRLSTLSPPQALYTQSAAGRLRGRMLARSHLGSGEGNIEFSVRDHGLLFITPGRIGTKHEFSGEGPRYA
jgi:hypothetical protein